MINHNNNRKKKAAVLDSVVSPLPNLLYQLLPVNGKNKSKQPPKQEIDGIHPVMPVKYTYIYNQFYNNNNNNN